MGQGSRADAVDPATRRARLVVGLYGDSEVTWSVVLRLRTAAPLDRAGVTQAVGRVHAAHPHLGQPPGLIAYSPEQSEAVLSRAAMEPYGDRGPLVRVALDSAGTELVVAMHHGCADGLGLLGYAAAVSGLDLPSSARGVPEDAEQRSFLRGSLARLHEALLHPPVRIASGGRWPDEGDFLLSRELTSGQASTAAVMLASVRAVRAWNLERRKPDRPVVVALGLSLRPGTPTPPPDRATAFARIAADSLETQGDAQRLIATTRPEPAFPVTRVAGLGPVLTRALRSRLGSSLLISNLGLIEQHEVERLEFWPVPSGPAGVCVGLASTPTRTTVTVRLRRGWFTRAEGEEFADSVVDQLAALPGERHHQ